MKLDLSSIKVTSSTNDSVVGTLAVTDGVSGVVTEHDITINRRKSGWTVGLDIIINGQMFHQESNPTKLVRDQFEKMKEAGFSSAYDKAEAVRKSNFAIGALLMMEE